MVKIMYNGATIDCPDFTDYAETKETIAKLAAEGKYDWFEYTASNANVSLLIGPGIPFAIVDDSAGRISPTLTDKNLSAFIRGEDV
ncbi:hypothetical protein [Paenarthrobacter sp. YIM B13468]|uniref:hypothetical protein n=1 Tax=Paenarthrobacter sp. YIM B13468 TaxID=3366295 RepID=UPI00366C158F